MEEMQRLIGRRQGGEVTPRKPRTLGRESSQDSTSSNVEVVKSAIGGLVSDADKALARASSGHDRLQLDFAQLSADFKEVSGRRVKVEVVQVLIQHCSALSSLRERVLSCRTRSDSVSWSRASSQMRQLRRRSCTRYVRHFFWRKALILEFTPISVVP